MAGAKFGLNLQKIFERSPAFGVYIKELGYENGQSMVKIENRGALGSGNGSLKVIYGVVLDFVACFI
jgi:hypothetical protein